ncbi:MAG: pyridoxal-5-phosphate-dependent protein subunit beta, partial [Candidatus Cloacimonetes bacterium]|nr:pyridoxal-5-phosphate-dependent protein subunit beta [Candidatus Cloacimonadota bacterium]
MPKLINKINSEIALKNAKRCKERNIIMPTFRQLMHPDTVPSEIKTRLQPIGLWDIEPLNLFRLTWKNDIKTGLFGRPNFIEIPPEITGVKARIIGMVGKYFPTG